MKKIKDFIYDFNDVLVALLLVAAAGLVIFWRVQVVMAYPKAFAASQQETSGGIDIDFSEIDLHEDEVIYIPEPGVDPAENQTGDETDPSGENTEQTEENQPSGETVPEKNPEKAVSYIQIEVKSGMSWNTVGKALEESGLVSSAKEFSARVNERKVGSRLQIGKFELNTSMTLDEVIDKLIK